MNTSSPIQKSDFNIDSLSSIRNEIENFARTASQTLLNERKTYPIERFTHYFAPIFLGVVQPLENQNVYQAWRSEVGSLHIEVDVVDANGVVQFTVPALMDTSAIDLLMTDKTAAMRFSDINNAYDLDSRNFASLARDDYIRNLGSRLHGMFSQNKRNANNMANWLRIYEYYKVPTDFLLEQANKHLGTEQVNTLTQNATGVASNQTGLKDVGFDSQVTF